MVKIEELLEAGVHFGHRVTKWNPRMAPFIFGERNGIHIIDIIQTVQYLNDASNFLKNHVIDSKKTSTTPRDILFVGTKKQASPCVEAAAKKMNAFAGNFVDMEGATGSLNVRAHYVSNRWLGGLLTNWATMKICIDQLNELEAREYAGELNTLPKKERAILKKQYEKLNTYFGGIKTMKDRPSLVVIVGQDSEMNAVRECARLQSIADLNNISSNSDQSKSSGSGLRTITLLDTNCDPSLADIFIPANDDSTKSIELILDKLTENIYSHS